MRDVAWKMLMPLRLARIARAERDGVAAEVLAAYDQSVERLAAMGADIVDVTLPRSFRDYGSTSGRIMAAEAYALLSHIFDNNELPIDEAVRPRVRGGAAISSHEYLEVLAERENLKLEFAAATAHVDALLAPVTMTPAIPLETVDQNATPAFYTRWVQHQSICADWPCPTGLPRPVCRCRCRSSAPAGTRRWPCASAGPGRTQPTGTSVFHRWSSERAARSELKGHARWDMRQDGFNDLAALVDALH